MKPVAYYKTPDGKFIYLSLDCPTVKRIMIINPESMKLEKIQFNEDMDFSILENAEEIKLKPITKFQQKALRRLKIKNRRKIIWRGFTPICPKNENLIYPLIDGIKNLREAVEKYYKIPLKKTVMINWDNFRKLGKGIRYQLVKFLHFNGFEIPEDIMKEFEFFFSPEFRKLKGTIKIKLLGGLRPSLIDYFDLIWFNRGGDIFDRIEFNNKLVSLSHRIVEHDIKPYLE